MCDLIINKLEIHPTGTATFEKKNLIQIVTDECEFGSYTAFKNIFFLNHRSLWNIIRLTGVKFALKNLLTKWIKGCLK